MSDRAAASAAVIRRAFDRYTRAFTEITRRAKARFEERDWLGAQADNRERLELYEAVIQEVLGELRGELLAAQERDVGLWSEMRTAFSHAIVGHPASEIAETFFNSVTRRVFNTVGTNPELEYLDFRFERVPGPLHSVPFRSVSATPDTARAVRELLAAYPFRAPYADPEDDALAVAVEIDRAWAAGSAPLGPESIEVLEPVFYRRKGAYLVGRVRGGDRAMPLVLALVHEAGGVKVDAVLLTEDEVSIAFSFTRSYFFADVRRPADTIAFLRSLMPLKPVFELYTALGYHKHGKTEFYRALQRHLARTPERFERTPGARGMVMDVFALPSFDVAFKIIRDTFALPKQTTREEVKRRYRMVFAHDRAGRLVDAQAFKGLAFPAHRFSESLLSELVEAAPSCVRVDGEAVVIDYLYAERRLRPLDLYLGEVGPAAALAAALDYGQTIRDLAATGIFAGDLMLKNFGVTRHGRVVFYDYDELRLLSECRFRDLPEARTPDEELADEPWFAVGPDDVFPEELGRFVPFTGALRDAFLAAHACLYDPAYWREMQRRQAAGEVVDIYPYGPGRRLHPGESPPPAGG
jgi:isocitrate dehydrogenase kinase/phosphatase